jgi:monofunctional biosynthetic peptidoglycan transglycosylase
MRGLMVAAMIVVAVPVVQTVIYRFVPPPVTILMLTRLVEGKGLKKSWRPIERISPRLADAVIAAEDSGFCDHHGFDFAAMEKAAEANERHPGKIRGGSTISQQTAKNVFLWPGRDYVRKGLEAGYTVLIEAIWGKRRILETYLNVVEWGPGVYGAEAAAQTYFHVDADRLTPDQAARLAAVLPSPLKWKAAHPGRYVAKRSGKIVARAAVVREDDLSACVR